MLQLLQISFSIPSDKISHFNLEIIVGKSRIRQRTTLKVNDAIHFWVDLDIRQLISMSDPTLFDNDFKIKMAWDYP